MKVFTKFSKSKVNRQFARLYLKQAKVKFHVGELHNCHLQKEEYYDCKSNRMADHAGR